jgi:hypothetical protein
MRALQDASSSFSASCLHDLAQPFQSYLQLPDFAVQEALNKPAAGPPSVRLPAPHAVAAPGVSGLNRRHHGEPGPVTVNRSRQNRRVRWQPPPADGGTAHRPPIRPPPQSVFRESPAVQRHPEASIRPKPPDGEADERARQAGGAAALATWMDGRTGGVRDEPALPPGHRQALQANPWPPRTEARPPDMHPEMRPGTGAVYMHPEMRPHAGSVFMQPEMRPATTPAPVGEEPGAASSAAGSVYKHPDHGPDGRRPFESGAASPPAGPAGAAAAADHVERAAAAGGASAGVTGDHAAGPASASAVDLGEAAAATGAEDRRHEVVLWENGQEYVLRGKKRVKAETIAFREAFGRSAALAGTEGEEVR